MLFGSLIAIFVALGVIVFASLFAKRNSVFYFTCTLLSLTLIVLATIFCANYVNDFSTRSILLIVAYVPLFLMLYEPIHPYFKKNPKFTNEEVQEVVLVGGWLKKPEVAENQTEPPKQPLSTFTDATGKSLSIRGKSPIGAVFCESKGTLFNSLGFFMTAFLVAFSGLYIGKESLYAFLCAVPMAIFGLCIAVINGKLKGKVNVFDCLTAIFFYAGIGFLVGQAVATIIYSYSLKNILFTVGCGVLSFYALIKAFTKTHRLNFFLYAGLVLITLTIWL